MYNRIGSIDAWMQGQHRCDFPSQYSTCHKDLCWFRWMWPKSTCLGFRTHRGNLELKIGIQWFVYPISSYALYTFMVCAHTQFVWIHSKKDEVKPTIQLFLFLSSPVILFHQIKFSIILYCRPYFIVHLVQFFQKINYNSLL